MQVYLWNSTFLPNTVYKGTLFTRTGGSEGTTSARISGLGVHKSRGSTDPLTLELWMYIFSFLVTYTLYVHTCTCMYGTLKRLLTMLNTHCCADMSRGRLYI